MKRDFLRSDHEFLEHVRREEQNAFPRFTNEEGFFAPKEAGVYVYYSPSRQVRNGLFTKEMCRAMMYEGASLLSIGAGGAYLEQLLTTRFEIRSEQIVLTDDNPAGLPSGFEQHIFDMFGTWPDLERLFDFILFAQSTLFHVRFETRVLIDQLLHISKNALAKLKPEGKIIIGTPGANRFTDVAQQAMERHLNAYLTLEKELMIIRK